LLTWMSPGARLVLVGRRDILAALPAMLLSGQGNRGELGPVGAKGRTGGRSGYTGSRRGSGGSTGGRTESGSGGRSGDK
jgi:hypothetical protein